MIAYTLPSRISIGSIDSDFIDCMEVRYPVLVISSPSVIALPKVQSLICQLKDRGHVAVYGTVRPDAPFSDVDAIVTMGEHPPAVIIAIGGGSVIDSAKAAAVAFSSGGSYKNYFNGSVTIPERTNRLLAVPTTAGTGAELSYGAIVFDDANGVKGGLRGKALQPDAVFLDFELYASASPALIAESGFDCLTHAIETFVSKASSPMVQYQSIGAIRNIFASLEKASRHDAAAIRTMALTSACMGVNLALSSTCLPHRIQYVIGPATGTSHSRGLIALYPGWLFIAGSKQGPFETLSAELGMSKSELFARIRELIDSLNVPHTLTTLGIHEAQIADLARSVSGNLSNDPYFSDTATIEVILRKSL